MKKGYKHSKETKQKMREAKLGIKRPGVGGRKKGSKNSEEHNRKIKENNAKYWLGKKRDDPEYIKKISEAHKGQKPNSGSFKKTVSKGIELLGRNEYRNLHKWVEKTLGKPDTCEKCGKSGLTGRQIHWANKSGDYKKQINDWTRLCVRCHFYKDKLI